MVSAEVRSTLNTASVIFAIVGSVATAMSWLGNKLYDNATIQTAIVEELKVTQQQLSIINPKIDLLEDAIGSAKAEALAAKQRVDDLKEDVKDLKSIGLQNLSVSNSHTPIINETNKAVKGR
jgi:sensor domain CHASE-containing protein